MQKRDPLSLCSDPRLLVDELYTGSAAALEHRVQVVDRKADVMDPGPSLRHEASDW